MAKASANLFPYLHLVPAVAPASPAAGSQRLYLDSGNSNKLTRKDSSGTVVVVEGGGTSTGGILAYKAYVTATTYSTTSTTHVDADATNLAVTFTAPASGNVMVRLTAFAQNVSGTNQSYNWGVREGTTVMGASAVWYNYTAGAILTKSVAFAVTGLSAGSHTFKWSHYVSGGTGRFDAGAGTPAVMEIHALP